MNFITIYCKPGIAHIPAMCRASACILSLIDADKLYNISNFLNL